MTEQPTEPTVREWTYVGQRLDAKGKLTNCWLNEDGEHRYTAKLKATVVGGVYEIWAADASVYFDGKYAPRYLRRSEGNDQVVMWDALHRHARTTESARRAEKNAVRETELDATLQPLRARYRRMVGSADRAALLALVIQRITG